MLSLWVLVLQQLAFSQKGFLLEELLHGKQLDLMHAFLKSRGQTHGTMRPTVLRFGPSSP